MSVDARFPIVYADFPWSYRNKKTGGTHKSGASQHYQTMSLEEIKEFPMHDIIGDHGICFLWVPIPLKFEAVEVVNNWGQFTYKTSIIWKKVDGIGMGFWARGVIEELWILIKGNIKAFRWQGKNVLEESEYEGRLPVGFVKTKTGKIHSSKPHKMYDMIEEMTAPFPTLKKKVELFATEPREGWTSVGWELGSDVYEFAQHLRLPVEARTTRCSVCGWPLEKTQDKGCMVGDCSMRPGPKNLVDPYRARLEGQRKPFKVAA